MIKIDQSLLNDLILKANDSNRLRHMHVFHEKMDDPLQRMINVMNVNTYVQPHKHENPDKREVFIVLKGKAYVVEFDKDGVILDYILLDNASGNYACEIASGVWHSIICVENRTIVYELKDGPYETNTDKTFADWAPQEGDEKAKEYNQYLLELLTNSE